MVTPKMTSIRAATSVKPALVHALVVALVPALPTAQPDHLAGRALLIMLSKSVKVS